MSETDVSVVLSTYNRCDMLPAALESLLAQDARGVRYEVILVDNNSTDQTRQVVAGIIESGEARLRYVFEAKQGLPYARNSGISVAAAPIIAFTDDDVRVAPTWIAEIKRAFDGHPEVDSVGGKILPRWPREPPAWLTREHWVGPLALQDYGSEAFYVNAERPLSLAGANMAFRRTVFERLGSFDPALLGSSEDTEMLIRLWRSKLQSLYVPSILVTAEVQPERLRKAYHRNWFFRTGSVQALMRFKEIFDQDGRLDEGRVARETLFGMPAFIYREFLSESVGWLGAIVRRKESVAFTHENRLRYLVGYVSRRYEQSKGERSRCGIAEVVIFATALLKRRIRAVFGRMAGGVAPSSGNSPRTGRSGLRSRPNSDKDATD